MGHVDVRITLKNGENRFITMPAFLADDMQKILLG